MRIPRLSAILQCGDGLSLRFVSIVGPGGMAIAAHNADELFNAFFTTKRDGAGMGLAICRSIIEPHGGSIWASCNCDHGASFLVSLPALVDRLSANDA
jgi:C4-dicarboxylate-specific signal transduction histidine kinase